MVDGCFKKCVPRFHDAELNTGEQVCVDRCIAKYMDVRLGSGRGTALYPLQRHDGSEPDQSIKQEELLDRFH